MKPRAFLIGAVLAALGQTGALGWMILERNALLTGGTEVLLETGFIDPRDLFRGHYVTLELEISRIDTARVAPPAPLPDPGDPVWVTLRPGEGPFWQVSAVTGTPPPAPGARIQGTWHGIANAQMQIGFPIDRFFAPKRRAQALETFRRDQALGVILALGPEGAAAIKGITVEGTPLYVEPLF